MYLSDRRRHADSVRHCGYTANRQVARFRKTPACGDATTATRGVRPRTEDDRGIGEFPRVPNPKRQKPFLVATVAKGKKDVDAWSLRSCAGTWEVNETKLANAVKAKDFARRVRKEFARSAQHRVCLTLRLERSHRRGRRSHSGVGKPGRGREQRGLPPAHVNMAATILPQLSPISRWRRRARPARLRHAAARLTRRRSRKHFSARHAL